MRLPLTYGEGMSVPETATQPAPTPVDWGFAKAAGARLVSAGPTVTPAEAAEVVASIRAAARAARDPIAQTTGLHTPDGAPEALVVDRPGWIAANADSMASLISPLYDALAARRTDRPTSSHAGSAAVSAIGAKVAASEAGGLLAFMASKVLGQYDLAPQGTPRLLLVAPNMVHVERELKVDPHDFRLWVCMHEETHRVQFTAVPWLRQHLIESARTLAGEMVPDGDSLAETIGRITSRLPDLARGEGSVIDLVTTPEQKERIAELTAVMSLLEGHADVMMDEVGPAHIPSVSTIRTRFTERRKGGGSVDRVLRRLLGLEAKMRQYRDGATFVRGAIDQVGLDGFNAVWTSADTLPRPAEIEDPSLWVARVHG